MALSPKYFVYPFATAGVTASVPDPTQTNNTVSYQQGFSTDYSLAYSDPSSKNVPLNQFNQILGDITGAIQQIQQTGIPYFITAAMNDGTAFSYVKNAIVFQPTDGNIYQSLVNANTDVPPTSKWQLFGVSTSLYLNFAADTGGANAYVTAPSPAAAAYVGGLVVVLKPTIANTGASTINVNGLGAVAIKTLLNQDPTAGMMIPSGMYFLIYNATTNCFVLTNPTLGSAAYGTLGTANGDVPLLNNTASASGKLVMGTVTIQWGVGTASGSGSGAANTFGTPFSGTPWSITCTAVASSLSSFTTGGRPSPATNTWSDTGFNALCDGGNVISWIAIGPT